MQRQLSRDGSGCKAAGLIASDVGDSLGVEVVGELPVPARRVVAVGGVRVVEGDGVVAPVGDRLGAGDGGGHVVDGDRLGMVVGGGFEGEVDVVGQRDGSVVTSQRYQAMG
ncbi:hypothetical protein GCM10010329_83140 [Streptomyces spiroverticillatus]|uniref:Uncharacterized protein n=1 Tax=Streptomyces finlayi TaxID=67296 RepID=A0A918X937_9ACTN|nr:hypothetical protein GCM10010329_83140 [Streptomyces spiroverticillatus]GHD18917.1 hypothetical protein GCM10010334_82200 [Streptomyces finlayi]